MAMTIRCISSFAGIEEVFVILAACFLLGGILGAAAAVLAVAWRLGSIWDGK
jgi:hypothetical protein